MKIVLLLSVLGGASIIFGFYLLFTGVRATRKILESKSWMKTSGIVTDARMAYELSKDMGDQKISFHLIKTYSYSVSGTSYTSDQRWASDIYFKIKFKPLNEEEKAYKQIAVIRKLRKESNRELAMKMLEAMKGDKVKVYYNPHIPSEACLSTKIPLEIYLHYIFSVFTFAAGTFMLYFAFKSLAY